MNRSALLAFGLAGALALAASPASAQHRRDGGGERRDNAPRTEERQAPPQAQPQAQPRQREEQRAAPRQDNRETQRAIPRNEYRREEDRRVPQPAPRYDTNRRYDDRRYDNRGYNNRGYDNRRYDNRGYYNGGYYNGGRYYSGRYYGPRYVGPRFSIAPRHFYRPYYVFRPRFSLGFGIWAGFPVTYYDPYYYPYDYYPYSTGPAPGYPPPPQGSVNVQPYAQSQSNFGGLSFDITPNTAEIYVDGEYFGEVGQFTPSSQPLGLPAGRHHVELREPGYQMTSFDVDVIAGQVIPYQGQLQP